jgi:hypothetical protein
LGCLGGPILATSSTSFPKTGLMVLREGSFICGFAVRCQFVVRGGVRRSRQTHVRKPNDLEILVLGMRELVHVLHPAGQVR